MTRSSLVAVAWVALAASIWAGDASPEPASTASVPAPVYAPHTPTVIIYLSGLTTGAGAASLGAAITHVASASVVSMNCDRGYVRIRFDSHIVSYHQIAQAITDAGSARGLRYDPRIVISIPAYAKDGNAAQIDALFAGKRLNDRVVISAIDPAKGLFVVSFKPLQLDPAAVQPQGFNGGHLHHPIHDPPPRGLGLACEYLSDDDAALPPPAPAAQRGAPAP